MTMRQLRQKLNRDSQKGPREVPSSPDGAARALAGNATAYVLACRECGGVLLADGEGGWSCPVRDRHGSPPHEFVASYGNAAYCGVCGEQKAGHPDAGTRIDPASVLARLYELHARGVFALPDEYYSVIVDAAVALNRPR